MPSGPNPPDVAGLLAAPSPAVLTSYRASGAAVTSPVWFREHDAALEVVIAENDVKLKHLAADPRASLTVFEAIPPFRGVRIEGEPEQIRTDVTEARIAIAQRYLGAEDGARFAAVRAPAGVILRFPLATAKIWDLSAILPPPAR